MKKVPVLAMIALSLTGCGSIPGLSLFGTQDTTSTTSSAQQSFYSIMGVEGTDTSTDTASGSVGRPGGANLGQLLFDLLDTNADGTIAADEFSAAVRARRPTATDAQISELFAQLDQDQDDAIALDELQPKPRDRKGGRHGGRDGRMGPPPRDGHFGPPPGGEAPEDDAAPDQATEPSA